MHSGDEGMPATLMTAQENIKDGRRYVRHQKGSKDLDLWRSNDWSASWELLCDNKHCSFYTSANVGLRDEHINMISNHNNNL